MLILNIVSAIVIDLMLQLERRHPLIIEHKLATFENSKTDQYQQ